MPKYPEITVKLTGEDGNAFSLSQGERDAFYAEATSSNYDHLLASFLSYLSFDLK